MDWACSGCLGGFKEFKESTEHAMKMGARADATLEEVEEARGAQAQLGADLAEVGRHCGGGNFCLLFIVSLNMGILLTLHSLFNRCWRCSLLSMCIRSELLAWRGEERRGRGGRDRPWAGGPA